MRHLSITKQIAEYTIRFEIPLEYYSCFKFLDSFENSNELPELKIIFLPSDQNKFLSSLNDSALLFYFNKEISSQINCYSVTWEIGVLQAVCRFIGLVSLLFGRSTFLIHGTSVELRSNQGLCILGNGRGKTSLGVSLSRLGFRFISDEFSFLNFHSNNVYKVTGLPIHIRNDARMYLDCANDSTNDLHASSEQIGISDGETSKVKVTIFPEVTGKFSIRQLNNKEIKLRYSEALVDHIEKFFNPALDRVSINPDLSQFNIPKDFSLHDSSFSGLDSFIDNGFPAYHVTLGSIDEITQSSRQIFDILCSKLS